MLTPVDTIKIFQKQPGNIKFPAGTIIFNQGEPGDTMFGIISGEVEFSLNDQIIESLYAGDIFGEGAFSEIAQPQTAFDLRLRFGFI